MTEEMEKIKRKEKDKNTVILALALITHLYNTGKISELVYKNIKKEYKWVALENRNVLSCKHDNNEGDGGA